MALERDSDTTASWTGWDKTKQGSTACDGCHSLVNPFGRSFRTRSNISEPKSSPER
jgi:hypothetical protein